MGDSDDGAELACEPELAAAEAEAAVLRIALAAGGHATGDPLHPASCAPRRADAAHGLLAARQLELAARSAAGHYIRAARAGRMPWQEIGGWLGLGPAAAADGVTVAEAAFSFATGPTDPWDEPLVWWTCRACGRHITDRGPGAGHPADMEHGHGDGCVQFAVTVAAWDAEWTREA
jgi:hypothetical protein